MKTGRENVKYDEAGLPGVTLVNVEVSRCAECGEYEVAIPRIAELHAVLARGIAKKPGRLDGNEVRFLRKFLGFSAGEFAKIIDVHPSTMSRWETGKEPIGKVSDRLLRALVIIGERVKDYPIRELAEVAQDDAPAARYEVRATDGEWQMPA